MEGGPASILWIKAGDVVEVELKVAPPERITRIAAQPLNNAISWRRDVATEAGEHVFLSTWTLFPGIFSWNIRFHVSCQVFEAFHSRIGITRDIDSIEHFK